VRGVAGRPEGIDVIMLCQQENIGDLTAGPPLEELLLVGPARPVSGPAKVDNRERAIAKGRASM